MGLFSFFKAPRHQRFNYQPRYYDPGKDKVQEIISQYQTEGSVEDGVEKAKARISRNFQSSYARKGGQQTSQFNKRSNIMLVAIILALLFLAFVLLNSYLPRIIQYLES